MGARVVLRPTSVTIEGPRTLAGIDVELSDMPDVAQTLAVVCAFATGPSTIRGLRTLRVKETDRLAALSAELEKLGAHARVEGDTLAIAPPAGNRLQAAAIDTYDDHRMAMSFAVAGTRAPCITIRDVECASKTYPRFFEDLKTVARSSTAIFRS
jgi:3-phosphoshikimate 1-carboxyvinyltransferase